MALRYVCDMCEKEVKKYIKIGNSLTMYCEKCWINKNNWVKIHKDAAKNSKF